MATKAQRLGIAADSPLANLLTKRSNYLLSSAHAASLRRISLLISAGRIRVDATGTPVIAKKDGSWAGNCGWEISQLESRGLVHLVGDRFEQTENGVLALTAALLSLNTTIDIPALLVEIDARRDAGL